jgi:hypothetical protein
MLVMSSMQGEDNMKFTVNRNIKHSGFLYLKGKSYDSEECGLTEDDLEQLGELVQVDVFTQKNTEEKERQEEIKLVEEAPENAKTEKPIEVVKTAPLGK